jgi:hypothetical protein
MTTVRLEAVEADGERLPPVCMWCGAPADGYFLTEFRRVPVIAAVCFLILVMQVAGLVRLVGGGEPEVFFGICCAFPSLFVLTGLGFLFLLLSVQAPGSRMTVSAPLCAAHCRHWRVRRWWLAGGSVLLVACATGGMLVAGLVMPLLFSPETTGVFVVVTLLGLAVLRTRIKRSGIHARKISSADIVLDNVHPLFVVALREQQDARRQAELMAGPPVPPEDDRIRAQPPDAVRGDDRPQ